ncbi:MAG: hypothetical protein M0026_12555 [Nocardiopsaceae bacterium]|nr:hypothetical protein [Nocardiopsaceae bacterium]
MKKTLLTAVAGAVLATGIGAAPAAQAEEKPDFDALLEMCDEANTCEFHLSGSPVVYAEESKEVTTVPAVNCTNTEQERTAFWMDARGERDWWEVSLTHKAEILFVQSGFSVFYSQAEDEELLTRKQYEMYLPPGKVGYVYQKPLMQRTEGIYELHFEDKQYGHYIWYIPKTIIEPMPDSEAPTGNGSVLSHSIEDMSEEDREHCDSGE